MLAHRALTDIDFKDKKLAVGLLSRIVRVDEKLARRKKMITIVSGEGNWSHAPSELSWHGHGHRLDQYSFTEERAFPRGTNSEQEKIKKKLKKKDKRKMKGILHSPSKAKVQKKRKKLWKNKEDYCLEEREQRKESSSRRKLFFKKRRKHDYVQS